MPSDAERTRATIIPTMRYYDAAAAIEWLCEAFGLERHLIVPGEDGSIVHAQLTFANSMIMLGSVREDEFGQLQKTPRQVGGVGTQSPYVIVSDADDVKGQEFSCDVKSQRLLKPELVTSDARYLNRARFLAPLAANPIAPDTHRDQANGDAACLRPGGLCHPRETLVPSRVQRDCSHNCGCHSWRQSLAGSRLGR